MVPFASFTLVCSFEKPDFFWCALSCFVVGVICHRLDVMRILCDPESMFQGHAIWHAINAFGEPKPKPLQSFVHFLLPRAALYFLYENARSEQIQV